MRQLVDVVVPLGVFSVFIVMLLYMPRFFFVYRIGERGIRIKLFGIVTHARIWWTEIASVQVVPRGDASLISGANACTSVIKKASCYYLVQGGGVPSPSCP